MNRKLLEENDVTQLMDTALHEIAHALAPVGGHGPAWRAMAKKLGRIPMATGYVDGLDLLADARYTVSCPRCGWSAKRGAYRSRWQCSRCRGPLQVFDRLRRRRVA